jgi:hypothetical protein
MNDQVVGLLLCDDMIFSSRITGTGQALGLTIKPARSLAVLEELLAKEWPNCLILDLGYPSLVIQDLIANLGRSGKAMPRIVAYGSHVDTATLQAARQAGCDIVLPRSKFVEELPKSLVAWLTMD